MIDQIPEQEKFKTNERIFKKGFSSFIKIQRSTVAPKNMVAKFSFSQQKFKKSILIENLIENTSKFAKIQNSKQISRISSTYSCYYTNWISVLAANSNFLIPVYLWPNVDHMEIFRTINSIETNSLSLKYLRLHCLHHKVAKSWDLQNLICDKNLIPLIFSGFLRLT